MIHKPNYEAQPSVIGGKKAFYMGKNPEGKAVFEIEEGFLLLKNGKTEIGKAIDEEGRLIPEEKNRRKEKKRMEILIKIFNRILGGELFRFGDYISGGESFGRDF